MGKYSLILFDSDGYTFITETKRLTSSSGRREKSSRLLLSYEGKLHTVEILELSDDLKVLESFDDAWIESVRGKAVTEERDRREASRSRRRLGGYLDIWPEEQDMPNDPSVPLVNQQVQTVLEAETVQQTVSQQVQSHENQFTPFDIQSNGRRVNILYQGLGESSGERARPVRQPQFQGDLTVDDIELVNEVVRQHASGKSTIQTQTEDVVVLGTEQEVRDLVMRDTSTKDTQTSPGPSKSTKDSQTAPGPSQSTKDSQTSPGPSKSTKDSQTAPGPSKSTKDSQTSPGPSQSTKDSQTSAGPSQLRTDSRTSAGPSQSTKDSQTAPGPSQSTKDSQTPPGPSQSTKDTQTPPGPSKSSKDSQTSPGPSKSTKDSQTSAGPSQSTKDSQTSPGPAQSTRGSQTSPRPSQSTQDYQTEVLRQHASGKSTIQTQTEDVVVLSTEQEVRDLMMRDTSTKDTQTFPGPSKSTKDSQTAPGPSQSTKDSQTPPGPSKSTKDSQTSPGPSQSIEVQAVTKFCQTEDRPASPADIVLIFDGPTYNDISVQTSRKKLTRSKIFIQSIEPTENRDLSRILEGQQKMQEKLDQLMKSSSHNALPVLSTPFIRSIIGEKENETPVQTEHLITRKVLADITDLGNRRELFPEDVSPAPLLPLKTPPTVPLSISAQSTPLLSPPAPLSPADSLSPVAALSPLKPQSPPPEQQSPTHEPPSTTNQTHSRPSSPTLEPPAKKQHLEQSTKEQNTKSDVLEVECPINARIVYVSSSEDICPGNVEFFVRKDIADTHFSESCSSGNFLWRIARILYKDEELVNTNYTGKKGKGQMSPRRKHTLKHIYTTYVDNSTRNFKRAISAVNNGILRMRKK